MQTRQIVHIPYEGCPEGQRQLRIWHNQDLIVWVAGTSYTLVATFFCEVFLANVAPGDTVEWAIVGGISLGQELLVIPFVLGVFVPLVLACALQTMSVKLAGKRQDHAKATRDRVCERGNMMLPVVQI
mmetsp:Transcript_41582/g.124239  ORF Transcript_41582/g.124239 Transcript_41582/m.124239 type:complete len:128 (+) Transcript_41582:3-386(+)